jgi:hypothetical protein
MLGARMSPALCKRRCPCSKGHKDRVIFDGACKSNALQRLPVRFKRFSGAVVRRRSHLHRALAGRGELGEEGLLRIVSVHESRKMSGKLFINYRRGEDSGFVGRLYDRLVSRYASSQIFLDVDSVPPGSDFVELLTEWSCHCDVFLCIIGCNWQKVTSGNAKRRLEQIPTDFTHSLRA